MRRQKRAAKPLCELKALINAAKAPKAPKAPNAAFGAHKG
jgi:hypothetical protein